MSNLAARSLAARWRHASFCLKRGLVYALVFAPSAFAATNPHPRIWLNSSMMSELRAKACIGSTSGCTPDPDYLAIKADADILKKYPPQKLTVAAMSNSNPITVTVNEDIGVNGWCGANGSGVSMFMAGLTGSWSPLNTVNSRTSLGAGIRTGPHTFTIPLNSTTWGAYPGGAVLFFNNASCGNMLYYDYEGLGWLAWFEELGLMYQLTGDASYATNAIALLDYINALAPKGLIAPFLIDSGFPARGAVLGVAIALDWFYPLLNSSQITATVATLNSWYDYYGANYTNPNLIYGGTGDAISNYWGGYMLGFGAAGYATDGETGSKASTMISFVRAQVDTYLGAQSLAAPKPGWYPDGSDLCPYNGGSATCGGSYYGGYQAEGYNYGPNHIQRLLSYLFIVKTATNEDMFATTTYAPLLTQVFAKNMLYSLFPNRWQSPNVGEAADVIPMYLNLPSVIAYLRQGQTESGWMQYLVQNAAPPPTGLPSWIGLQGASSSSVPFDRFLWYRPSIAPVDYTATQPTYFASPGQDGEIHWRSDWTKNATKLTFTAGAGFLAGHHIRNAGGVTLTRGADYLIINAGHYAGTNGYSGSSPGQIISDDASVLHFDDAGAYMFGYNSQQNWGTFVPPLSKLTTTYAYGQNDLTYAYDDKAGYHPASARTLKYYFRSVAQLGNVTLVYDRLLSSQASYVKKLYWYINPITTPVPSLVNNTASAVVGSSKVFVTPILPAAPTTALTQVPGGSPYRLEISDSAGLATASFVTLLYSTANPGTEPASAPLAASSNAIAVQVADATPVVFVHSNVVTDKGNNTYAATPQTSVSFTSTHSGVGNYLIGGLAAGTYAVTLNGSPLSGSASVAVGSDGALNFASSSGAFSVVQQSASVILSCDLNSDGAVNVLDVQLAVNQALGLTACTNGALIQPGVCNLLSVQRVMSAALGLGCKVGL